MHRNERVLISYYEAFGAKMRSRSNRGKGSYVLNTMSVSNIQSEIAEIL